MTMKLKITNEDEKRTAVVKVEDFQIGNATGKVFDAFPLAAGESREVWIHSARRVTVTEDALAEVPKA